jgi:hypothetical protein
MNGALFPPAQPGTLAAGAQQRQCAEAWVGAPGWPRRPGTQSGEVAGNLDNRLAQGDSSNAPSPGAQLGHHPG